MAIKGQNLRIMVGGKCIAMSTSCTLHLSAQLEDASTKDDDEWAKQEVVGLAWDVSTDSLVTLEDNGSNGELPTDLLTLITSKTKVTITFDQTAGANNRVGQNAAIKRTGQAWLNDFNITAQNRANATVTCQFTGDGPLTTA